MALSMFPLSPDAVARLDRFVALLRTWQRRTNLIAPSTVGELWTRHVADSLQLVEIVTGHRGGGPVIVDVGSGGGFPGMVIGCVVADVAGAEIHLVESNLKKAAFLREAVRETGAPAVVHAARFEEVLPTLLKKPVDYVTARAVAPLPELLELIAPLIQAGATAVLPKGRDLADELTESTLRWHIGVDTVPSRTNPAARIVIVTKLTPRSGNTGQATPG
jgi:16S rRNA (guanine527-N7)-methyltransferase